MRLEKLPIGLVLRNHADTATLEDVRTQVQQLYQQFPLHRA